MWIVIKHVAKGLTASVYYYRRYVAYGSSLSGGTILVSLHADCTTFSDTDLNAVTTKVIALTALTLFQY